MKKYWLIGCWMCLAACATAHVAESDSVNRSWDPFAWLDMPVTQDTLVAMEDTTTWMTDTSALRLALWLPLHAQVTERDKNMDRFYDFYAGALLAIYEEQSTGQKIDLYTCDIEKQVFPLQQALWDVEQNKVEGIIGPAYPAQVQWLLEQPMTDSPFILIPFLANVEGLEYHPNVMQFNPSVQTQADTLSRYLALQGDEVHCIFIKPKVNERVPASVLAIQRAVLRDSVPCSFVGLHDILRDSLGDVLRPEAENIFVFNTDRYENLQAVLPHVVAASRRASVTLLSHYSWQKEHIPVSQIYTSVFFDEGVETPSYGELFDRYFGHTLSSVYPRYDVLGYDLTRNMIQWIQMQRLQPESPRDSVVMSENWGLQSAMQFVRVSTQGGYENHAVHIIRK